MDLASTTTLILCTILGFIFLSWGKVHQKRRSLPPGPAPLPFFGTLRKIKPHALYKTFVQLSKEYGPVFTVWMGTSPVVVLCGYDMVKDALVNHGEEFSGRAFSASNQKVTGGNGEAFDPMMSLQSAAANMICLVMFGERFDYSDKAFLHILHTIDQYFIFIRSFIGQLYNSIPKIMDFLPGPHHRILEETLSVRYFVQEKIDWHKKTIDYESPRDYIDCFLAKKEKNESWFTDENLVASTFDMFIAGTETTTGSIQFSLLVMAKYPDVQEKVQQEIDHVVGPKRMPGIEDRVKMPYTNAVILEIQRFVDIVPMALPHSMTRDTEFHGYIIPKGTVVIPILTSVMHDPKQWETADEFNPQHFLDENGLLRNRAAFMPFSAGKRMCPGEGLARMEIFLFLAVLLQNFTFQPVDDPASLDLAVMRREFRNKGLSFQLRAVTRQHAPA